MKLFNATAGQYLDWKIEESGLSAIVLISYDKERESCADCTVHAETGDLAQSHYYQDYGTNKTNLSWAVYLVL